jgi:hypothetical protein
MDKKKAPYLSSGRDESQAVHLPDYISDRAVVPPLVRGFDKINAFAASFHEFVGRDGSVVVT